MKRAAKRILLSKLIFVQNAPQLQVSCQSHLPASSNELITAKNAPQTEDFIQTADINSAKTNSTNSFNKAGFSSPIFEQIHSTNLSARSKFDHKFSNFEEIAKNFINLIEVTLQK